jgi:MFS family permease
MRRRLPPVLRRADFSLYLASLVASGFATQMMVVAIGWQVYELTGDPLDLGLIGLAEFLPLPLLALPAGQLADRISRRLLFAVSLVLEVVVTALLLVVTLAGTSALWPFVALAFALGIARALGNPAARAMPPTLVPARLVASAMAVRSVGTQVASVTGPALGGLLFALEAELVYAVSVGLLVLSVLCTLRIRERAIERSLTEAPGLRSLLAGIAFLRRTPVLLGAISLDLFAVLFGGAVALLPIFARDILEVGPAGLGVLRSAPAVGAFLAAIVMVRRPLARSAGRTLLVAVGVFGASMVVFGLSRSFLLSLAALAVSGAADMVSVNIRATTVALATPDDLRGRVTAVEMVFISASNELGAFESGVAASLVGTVPAVVAGGALTMLIAGLWVRLFPDLARIDRLEDVRPGPD